MKYDHICSIGDNCEVGGNLARYGFSGDLLRYAKSNIDSVNYLFESNFEGLFEDLKPIGSGTLVQCLKYDIAWHVSPKFRSILSQKDPTNKAGYYDLLSMEKEKLQYLVKKLFVILKGNQSVCFIYKSSNIVDFCKLDMFTNLIEKRYPKLNFKVLVVRTHVQESYGIANSSIIQEYVDFLAPEDNTIKGSDSLSWAKILNKYSVKSDNDLLKLGSFISSEHSLAELLRELALLFERSGEIGAALSVMSKANVVSPDGPVINSKIIEYSKRLKK